MYFIVLNCVAMILYNSRLINDMKHPRPVLYLNNNYEIGSEEIITTLIEAGIIAHPVCYCCFVMIIFFVFLYMRLLMYS